MSKRSIAVEVPAWAQGLVWYQIMPERFRNGDPNNTPKAADQKNAWPHDHTSPFERHRWSSQWYALEPYEKKNGRDIWHNIQRRRYGGDLTGIIDRLDYLQDLGIGGLYLNPVFEAPSHHKYDSATLHHVDPAFGPDPDGDRQLIRREEPHDPSTWVWTSADELLLELIGEVHRRGMYIILDGVFNHMGLNSWIYQDILRHQRQSRFRDWMDVLSWADEDDAGRSDRSGWGRDDRARWNRTDGFSGSPRAAGQTRDENQGDGLTAAARPGFSVRTWEGYRELPELRQDRRGIVDGPRRYLFDITRRWMDPFHNGDTSNGVDGWRLDVAYCIRHPFWKEWRRHVRSINPQAYLVAEIIDTPARIRPYLRGDEFDAVMNYGFKFACNKFFIWNTAKETVEGLDQRLTALWDAFPGPVGHAMQNLLGSHDTDRVASRIVNRALPGRKSWSAYHQRSRAENGEYDTRKPTADERLVQKRMILVQMTWPGAPMIYYGDEAGMWGANDPCCRKPMVWPDYDFEAETLRPDGRLHSRPQEVSFDEDLHRYYRTLIHLRNRSNALVKGDCRTLLADGETGMWVYRRQYGDDIVLVALNTGPQSADAVAMAGGAVTETLFVLGEAGFRKSTDDIHENMAGGREVQSRHERHEENEAGERKRRAVKQIGPENSGSIVITAEPGSAILLAVRAV